MENRKTKNTASLRKASFLLFVALLLFLTVCSTAPSQDSLSITILHTNDHHGQSRAFDFYGNRVGGLAERLTLIKSLREEAASRGDFCLLLDAGDISSGTLFSDTYSAEPDWKVYGKYYDAMTPGNHDFDFPLDGLLRFIDVFKVPVLSANVYDRRTGSLLFPPYKIFRKDGWSIAVIGICHPGTPIISTLGNDERLEFRSAVEAAGFYVDKLREENDMVIVLSHWGKNDVLLAQKVEGIDLIIGGHSHSPLKKPMERGKALIVNAGYGGRYVGHMTLQLQRTGGGVDLKTTAYELIPVTAEIPPDEDVQSILQPYLETFGDRGQSVAGEAGEAFSRAPLAGLHSSSNLANLVADAFRFVTEADIAFVNRGGLRADLDKGPVTVEELHAVLPFDNTLIVFEIPGSQVLEILKNMISGSIGENGLLFPSNLKITEFQSGEPDVRSGSGESIIPDKIYTVAVGSFIARGGDGHKIFLTFKKKYDTEIRTSDALRKYFEAKKTVFPDNLPRLK